MPGGVRWFICNFSLGWQTWASLEQADYCSQWYLKALCLIKRLPQKKKNGGAVEKDSGHQLSYSHKHTAHMHTNTTHTQAHAHSNLHAHHPHKHTKGEKK